MVSFILLCLLLGLGHLLRVRVKLLQKLYLPSCVVAGLVGLCIIQLIYLISNHIGDGSFAQKTLVFTDPWSRIPGFLINIVFACLFLGVKIPKFSHLFKVAKPQIIYGQIVAWGQYVVGIGLFIIGGKWIFKNLPAMFAGILPVGFEGGHGTAAGMAEVFEHHGWAEGKDFALTSATFGIVSAIIVGMILVNWAVRKGYVQNIKSPSDIEEDDSIAIIPVDQRPSAGRLTVNSDVVEAFSLQIVAVAIAIGIGYLIKELLMMVEVGVPFLSENKLLSGFPLFPLCMIGGFIVQIFEDRFDKHNLIDLGLMRRIQNSSLDFLVIAAIATIKVQVVLSGLLPLMLLVAAGIAWNVFCVLFLARRFFKDSWFERAIVEMGQSMGVTATGLLLLRVVDPDYKTEAADAFACKQLVHEPFMGGGLWTASAIPLIAIVGAVPVFFICLAAIVFWLVIALLPKFLPVK